MNIICSSTNLFNNIYFLRTTFPPTKHIYFSLFYFRNLYLTLIAHFQ